MDPIKRLIYALAGMALLTACRPEVAPEVRQFIFLGHPYDWNDGYRLDPRLEKIDFSRFDQVWLGGDVCSRATERPETLAYLDSLLDFSGGHVQWTLGNHDVMFNHLERITERTGQPTFYCTGLPGGITLLVLNTNLFWMYDSRPEQIDCAEKAAQMELITTVLDTIRKSAQLVILHHHALLKDQKPDSLQEAFNTNPARVAISCDSSDQFSTLVYPKLVTAQQRGVQVILVGGDLGMRIKRFQYQTPEGIWLLGSGINNSLKKENKPDYVTTFDPDQILIFRHDPATRKLTWDFVLLNDWLTATDLLLENRRR